jgi:hypothetical protein
MFGVQEPALSFMNSVSAGPLASCPVTLSSGIG